ncbi:PREDICTED: pentatricopeptide repeat-containing protein At5g52850, chloroplastic [Tarenaya hassleriana]|uniref:pentatricopeptide repeat-containing protein At5g52850, chloroplastic n=1 Tax=Tarenaya hassleriana TaxID=28532 RepID=UPI00053C411F|nr:PREDICTED: pentatricopeptide repeat-containing protein At5g52850, chloroplastic [Tarenaya hassleriana]
MTSKAATTFLSRKNELAHLHDSCLRILSICNSISSREGLHIHSPIIKLGLQGTLDLCNNLLRLYSKSDCTGNARKLFEEMLERDVVSWTVMISAYTKSRQLGSALEVFDEMLISGIRPNEFTFSSVLRSCAGLGHHEYGARVHCSVVKNGFEVNPVICSGLIDFYSKCGKLKEARELFVSVDNGDTISWTTMISSMVEARKWSDALKLYVDMIDSGIPPNEFTYVKLLNASSFLGLGYGELLHAHVIVRGVLLNVVLKTSLVGFYSRFGRMEEAVQVLNSTWDRDRDQDQDVFLWTSVVSGFARNSRCKEAVATFHEMQVSGFPPNNFTYSALLSVCSSVQSLDLGKQIHSQTVKVALEDSVDIGNSLMNMYMKCSSMEEDALRVFRSMSSPDVISWTTLISGLVDRHGFERDCVLLLMEMVRQGVQPNAVTLSCVLRACSQVKSVSQVLEIHGYILRRNLDGEIIVGNSLVDVYASSGKVNYAWKVATMMEYRDNITYTILVTRFNELGKHEMALTFLNRMREEGIKMDQFSFPGFVSASANLGALETGKHLHCYSVKAGFSSGMSVSNALVDMYGKFGFLECAKKAFNEIPEPDVVSWNGLISGLASNGCIAPALSTFEDMRLKGIQPDSVTFLILLSACINGKITEMGLEYFRSMTEVHNIEPQIDHYAHLLEILGRAGRLEEAAGVLEMMPLKPNALIYKTLLRACRFHMNLPLGEDMANRGIALAPCDPAFYILLADLYDDSGKPDLAQKTRHLMKEMGLSKKSSQSSVEIRGKVHNFVTGDVESAETVNEIHREIESLKSKFKRAGYRYRDNEDASYHSAKRAVAFGLLNASPKAVICVVKNKSLCRDCHNFMSLATRLLKRSIIVRDGNRIHTFKSGECSCREETSFF